MKSLLLRSVLLFLLFLLPLAARAQSDAAPQANASSARETLPPLQLSTGQNYFGLDLGATYSMYSGASNFLWPMRQDVVVPSGSAGAINSFAQFDNLGSGLGFVFGVKGGFAISNAIDVEAKIRYLTNYTSSSDENHKIPIGLIGTGTTTEEPVTNSYNLLLSNLDFDALLHVGLSKSWYAAGGLSFSTLLSNRLSVDQKKNGGDAWTYYDIVGGGLSGDSAISTSGSQSTTFSTSRLGLLVGAGSVFSLGSGSTLLDAELLLSIPLTRWLTDSGESASNRWSPYVGSSITFPKLWYASLTIGIRFPFGGGGTGTDVESESETHAASAEARSEVDPDGKVPLTGTVTDSKTGKPLPATMTVVDLTNNKVVATDETDGDGRYNIRVKAPGKYSVTADANGHLFGTAYFEVDPQGRILSTHPDIKLGETTNGRTRLLVFFDFNASDLKGSSYPELDRSVKLMKAVPTMQVEIAGYTDSIGTAEYNRQLSEYRANAVRDYLIRNGIAKNRIQAHGYGEDSPIADNGTEAGRAENRRVEFVVLSK